ncbi:MAG TPA: NnrU family protein [Beijerinckiaceae bacterium]|nr:NnrU family protein [Beijerinckiaceae bacterium]
MSLLPLILGLALFFAAHVFTTFRVHRAGVIERLGAGPYRGLYSVASAVGLALIVFGFGYYRARGYIPLWDPPRWTGHIALTLMPVALVLVASAYMPAGLIKTRARHPFLAGVKLWALAHLLANGDLGSFLLFASFLAYAVYDRIAIKRRGEAPREPRRVSWTTSDTIAVALGALLYSLIAFWLHEVLFGVAAFVPRAS